MANYLGTKLSRLVRLYAYTSGEVPRLVKAEADLKAQLADIRSRLRKAAKERAAAEECVASLAKDIEAASALQTEQIRSIQATPRRLQVKYGTFTAALVDLLKSTDGTLTTRSIVDAMTAMFDMPHGTLKEREWSRRRVARQLRVFLEKGAVERMEDDDEGNGVWKWCGIQEEDAGVGTA